MVKPITFIDICDRYERKRPKNGVTTTIAAILFALLVLSLVFASRLWSAEQSHPFFNGKQQSAQFYKETKRGWFYYETIREPLEANNSKIEEKPIANVFPLISKTPEERQKLLEAEKSFIRSIPFDNLQSLSAEEFRQIQTAVQDIATMRPDLENSLAYLRLNKYITDQASRFADVMMVASNENEFIDPSLATSAYGDKLIRLKEKEKVKSFFETNKERLAIAIFYAGVNTPSYNNQKGSVEAFQKNYPDTEVLWIDVSNSPDTIEKMGLVTLPETWLAWRKDDGSVIYRRIASGAATYEDFEKKPLFLYEKTIAEDIFATTTTERK